MAAEDDVRAASATFYAALNSAVNGDPAPIAAICSQGADAATMHPIGGRQVGWEEVWATWRLVASVASAGKVVLADQVIRVMGEVAFELGTENAAMTVGGQSMRAEARATTIYCREGGAWKLVHHHTDAAPAMQVPG